MKFFEDIVCQQHKQGYIVCGDTYQCERVIDGAFFVMCDGIGSGIYANNASIVCASRLTELFKRGVSPRSASEMVAASMHRARKEDIPFSAFTTVLVLPDGQFTAYTYETPELILLRGGSSKVLTPRFYTAGYEVVGEVTGTLEIGDSLLFYSDGVSQAGLGHSYALGIGANGISQYINRVLTDEPINEIPTQLVEMCQDISGGRYEDDTTLIAVHCREAKQITVMTGPPSHMRLDQQYVSDFMAMPGTKVVCGSTTLDIICREQKLTPELVKSKSPGSPPEYKVEGIDLATEGAIMLNQVYNILDEPDESFMEFNAVERFCLMLQEADVINLMNGDAANDAHSALIFKQMGIRSRKDTVKLIAKKLHQMGKTVTIRKY